MIAKQFKSALVDGFGRKEAKNYELFQWGQDDNSALAVSYKENCVYLMFLNSRRNSTKEIHYSACMEKIASLLDVKLKSAKTTGTIVWGTENGSGVCAYRFDMDY
ncbi:hypothetical protein [Yersinia sp. Marseille-Q3913]|uniref:hypothetical protein n=1 Tax=Yersinia sp. Marseille-Q3913 TaxID=2830769 RepID=UPI001BB02258|nr:hypothetical protein [Yersinia sp. Marseille-Q3913]MBS0057653.1 hypothetical protein [Yersinia sp. Marseille-Q3913]